MLIQVSIVLEILKSELKKFRFLVELICILVHKDRFDHFQISANESPFHGFTCFGGGTYAYAISYHKAVRRLFLAIVVRASPMYTGDIVAMQVNKFQKDRDEQARFGFKFLSLQHALCRRIKSCRYDVSPYCAGRMYAGICL